MNNLLIALLITSGSPLAAQQGAGQGGQFQQVPNQPQQNAANQPQQNSQKQIVAMVNGEPITMPEFNATVQQRLAQLQQQAQAQGQEIGPDAVEAVRKESLDLLIDSRLVEEHAIEKGPEVPEQEVESAVDGIKQQLQGQQVSYEDFLAQRGHTEESLQTRIKASIAWQKFQQQEITQENLQDYFQKNQQQFGVESIEQVPQQQLVQSYSATLWENIIEEKKPNADIKVLKPEVVGAANGR